MFRMTWFYRNEYTRGAESSFHMRTFSQLLYLPGACMCAKSLQACPTLCNAMDCSPPCSSVHEILQARILEWVAKPFFRGSS